jgi:hypothetical protein
LEELRLLSNVNSEKEVALQIMLVGQPELRRKLQRPELKQFAQRVSIDFHLNALALPETEAYVRHRLTLAGGSEAIFERPSIELIHERSGGIPRVINLLCDLCLVYTYAEGLQQVTAPIVAEVLRDKSRGYAIQPAAPTAVAVTNGATAPPMIAAAPPPATHTEAPVSNGASSQPMITATPPPIREIPAREIPAREIPAREAPVREAPARETQGTARRVQKVGRLPLNIGVPPARPEVEQPKKPRARTLRSWFFFS